jgi:ferric-dicitrate binding protein FerR (iron transport regulator)
MQRLNRVSEVAMEELTVNEAFPMYMFLSVGSIALFSFIAVASWADARRKEREAYYRSETLKKLAETQGPIALELLRQQETEHWRERREGVKLGGLVTGAVGIGLMVLLRALEREPVYLVGLIPLLIGVSLLAYGFFLAPRD